MHDLKKKSTWLYAGIGLGLICFVIYIIVSQTYRLAANEPQNSIVKDVVHSLNNGAQPGGYSSSRQINIDSDMSPFVIIYDRFGKPVGGDGYIAGELPRVPIGVLAATKGHKYNRVTWQPTDKIRIASVSTESDNYYVLAGRSLRVVESQIRSFGWWLMFGYVTALALMFASYKLLNKDSQLPTKNK